MSVEFREVMSAGTPRQVLRALKNKRSAPDHEDVVLLLKNVLELIDELDDRQRELEARLNAKDTPPTRGDS